MAKQFWKAVDGGNVELLRGRFAKEVSGFVLDGAGSCALHRAARNNRLDTILLLVREFNYDVNVVCTQENKTPLYEAACEGHVDACKLLINELNADASISKFNEWNPLHIAACKGFTDLIPVLTAKSIHQHSPPIQHRNKDGALPLHLACREAHANTVRALVDAGSELNIRNRNGRTPFLCACASGSVATLEALLTNTEKIDQSDAAVIDVSGFTPMHEVSTVEAVEWLLEQDDGNAKRWLGYVDICQSLPVHIAASNNRAGVLRSMLQRRPDLIDARDDNECTALHLASVKGFESVAQVLVQFMCNETLRDRHGRQALQVAMQWNRSSVVEVLERKSVVLSSEKMMPTLGFGTCRLEEHTYEACLQALQVGYRCIDCAEFYGNEEAVGRAIRDSGVDRSSLFIISKVWNSNVSSGNSVEALCAILQRLQLDYLDLVLVHWPCKGFAVAFQDLKLHPELAREVGTSNFLPEHVEAVKTLGGCYPAVNQIEFSAYFPRFDQIKYFLQRGIVVQAYRSLGKEGFVGSLRKEKETQQHVSPRVLLRWCLQHGACVIPKSSKLERIKDNMKLFDFALSAEEMHELDQLAANSGVDVEAAWMATVFQAAVNKDVL